MFTILNFLYKIRDSLLPCQYILLNIFLEISEKAQKPLITQIMKRLYRLEVH